MQSVKGEATQRGGIVLAIVAGAVSGATFGAFAWLALADSGPGAAPVGPAVASSADLAELRNAIDQLRAALQDHAPAPSAEQDVADPPAALGPSEAATRSDVTALAAAVEQLASRIDLAMPPRFGPHLEWDATKRKALVPFLDRKHPVSVDAYLFRTEAELVEAYGLPNAIVEYAGKPAWLYLCEDEGKQVVFEFLGGRVVKFHVE